MTQYVVYVSIPYAGDHEAFYGNREELKEWLNEGTKEYSLDDMRVLKSTDLDLYALVAED